MTTPSAPDRDRAGAPVRIAAVVLAAGRGRRYGGTTPKPLLPLGGSPLLAHALHAAVGSGLRPVLVVVGHHADDVAAAVPSEPEVEVVRNDAHATGISSSLVAALRALVPRAEVAGAVIGLADQPLVGPDAYRRLAAAYDEGARLAYATYGGERANPVLVAREHWDEALRLTGDEAARVLLRTRDGVAVPCDGTGEPLDVDTPEDLAALEARWRRSQTRSE